MNPTNPTPPISAIDRIAEDLRAIEATDVARLPESVFKHFLPMFLGESVTDPKISPAHWIAVAGSPYRTVNVFDDKTNEVLFVVPPYFEPNRFDGVKGSNEIPISHILITVQQLAQRSPREAQNYMENILMTRMEKVKNSIDVKAYIEQWDKIFAFYGKPTILKKESNEANATAGNESAPRGDLTATDFTPA